MSFPKGARYPFDESQELFKVLLVNAVCFLADFVRVKFGKIDPTSRWLSLVWAEIV
jgi:hypothetical protein